MSEGRSGSTHALPLRYRGSIGEGGLSVRKEEPAMTLIRSHRVAPH
ncbi:hypothetical protein BLA9940_03226 [Burkholderia aenigmatica]|nr:hypothetical protein BLA9940_03226 [Burkholderia aenigmatica]